MAEFTASVFQNEFLAEGSTDVHAVITACMTSTGQAGGDGDAAEIIIVDCSRSMAGSNMKAAQQAAIVAIDQILDGTWFAVIAGNHLAHRVFPFPNATVEMTQMDSVTRQLAKDAVNAIRADGGTAMGTWLTLARRIFETEPQVSQRHAILLTDGKNEHQTPEALASDIASCEGYFQCDARGIGEKWIVAELRSIASALLGTVGLAATAEELEADFAKIMNKAMSRGVSNADLRVWTPRGSDLLFVRQVSPDLEDLTDRGSYVNALTRSFPTGSWGDECRDYHIAVRVAAQPIGAEQLAARVQVVVRDEVVSSGLVKARWINDPNLTAGIDPSVAHYTGQAELALAIQEGLAARAVGDEATATVKLGRAVQLANASGNEEATSRLRKVVVIDDPAEGTVRLKREVAKLDEMALDTASTKTTRVRQ